MSVAEAGARAPLDQLLLDLRGLGWLTPSDALLLDARREQVEAENERLREALRGLIECHPLDRSAYGGQDQCGYLAAAKAALSGSSAAEGAE